MRTCLLLIPLFVLAAGCPEDPDPTSDGGSMDSSVDGGGVDGAADGGAIDGGIDGGARTLATEGQLISAELNAGGMTMEGFFTVEANGMPGAVIATIEYSGEGAPAPEELVAESPEVVRAVFESPGTAALLPRTPEGGLTLHIGDDFSVGTALHSEGMFGELEFAFDQRIDGFQVLVQGPPDAMLGAAALSVRVSGEGWEEDVAVPFVTERYIFAAEVNASAFEFDHRIEARLMGQGSAVLATLRELGQAAHETSVIDEVTFGASMVSVRAARYAPPCDLVAENGICLGGRLLNGSGDTVGAVSFDEVGTIVERLFVGGSGMDAEEVVVELVDAEGAVIAQAAGTPTDGRMIASVTAGRDGGEVVVDLRDTAGLRRDRAINGDTDAFTMAAVVGPIASRVASVRVLADGAGPGKETELAFHVEWVDADIPIEGDAPTELYLELTTPGGEVLDEAGGTLPGVLYTLSKEQRRLRIRRRIRKRISGTAVRPDITPPSPDFTVLGAELSEEGAGGSLIVVGRGDGAPESLTYRIVGEGIDTEGTLGPSDIGSAHYSGMNPGAASITIAGVDYPYTNDLERRSIGADTDLQVTIDARGERLDVRIAGPVTEMEGIGAVPGADIVTLSGETLPYVDYDHGWFMNMPGLSPELLGRSITVEGLTTLGDGRTRPYLFTQDFGAESVLEEVVMRAEAGEFLAAVSVYVEDGAEPTTVSLSVEGDMGEVLSVETSSPVAMERVFEASVELTDLNDATLSVALSGAMGPIFDEPAVAVSIGGGWQDIEMGARVVSVRVDRNEGEADTVRVSILGEDGLVGEVSAVQEVTGVDVSIDQGMGPVASTLLRVSDRLGYNLSGAIAGVEDLVSTGALVATVSISMEGRGPEVGTNGVGSSPSVSMGWKKFVKKYKGKTKFDRKMNESFTDN